MEDFTGYEPPPGTNVRLDFLGGPVDGGVQVTAAPRCGDYVACSVPGDSGYYTSDVPWNGQPQMLMRYSNP